MDLRRIWALALAVFFVATGFASDRAAISHTGTFMPVAGVKLCAELGPPCAPEILVTGGNADTTITLSSASGELLSGGVVSLLAQSASIPGPETNGQCSDSIDNDGDGVMNEGCPPVGYDVESNRCDTAVNDDPSDDAYTNDGCPAVGSAESICTGNADDDGDTKVNDGCPAQGIVLAETNAWCNNATNEDPRDDAAAGALKVNDGCPAVGGAETACDDAVDSDADTKVNDGCPISGGIEPEVNECLNAADDDQDGVVNDGCPEPALSSPLLGALAGKLKADQFYVGLANTPCSTQVIMDTEPGIFNSTTQNALWNEWGMGDSHIYGAMGPFRDDYNGNNLPTHVDRYPEFLNLMFDPDRVGDINGDGDHFDTVNGVVENPGASPLDWYGTVEPLRPVARYSASIVVTQQALLFQLVVFSPGAFAAYKAPHPLSDLASPALGFPAVFVLQAPTANPAPEPITDICSPSDLKIMLWGKTRDNPCTGAPCNTGNDRCINGQGYGTETNCPTLVDSGDPPACAGSNERGCVRYANPSTAGTHYFGVFQQSVRDTDGDGIENGLDTCPFSVNVENPRSSAGPDSDMLDSACDPNSSPGTGNNPNQDGDTCPCTGGQWTNAADNCPLAGNPDNKESERDQPYSAAAPRGGSRLDGMGDECDVAETACADALDNDPVVGNGPTGPDGLINDGCPAVGGVAAEGVCTYSTTQEVDNDFDGYPNDGCPAVGAAEAGAACENFLSEDDDNGDTVIDASDSVNDGCPLQGGPERGCLNSTDDDADTYVNDGCPPSSKVANGHFHTVLKLIAKCIGGVDADGDGYCASGSATVPADPNDANANIIPETYSQFRPFMVAHAGSGTNPPAAREPLQICNDGIDNDGDGLIDLLDGTSAASSTTDDCRPPDTVFTGGVDTDGDGAKDEVEIHVGTDPLSRCGRGLEVGTTPSAAWPMDLRGDSAITGDKINISDLASFNAPVDRDNTSPGDANFDRRWDLRPGATVGKWINVADLAVISTQNPVPMYGVRAYGFFSVCSAHPVYGD